VGAINPAGPVNPVSLFPWWIKSTFILAVVAVVVAMGIIVLLRLIKLYSKEEKARRELEQSVAGRMLLSGTSDELKSIMDAIDKAAQEKKEKEALQV